MIRTAPNDYNILKGQLKETIANHSENSDDFNNNKQEEVEEKEKEEPKVVDKNEGSEPEEFGMVIKDDEEYDEEGKGKGGKRKNRTKKHRRTKRRI
jgi:hypothetical protein